MHAPSRPAFAPRSAVVLLAAALAVGAASAPRADEHAEEATPAAAGTAGDVSAAAGTTSGATEPAGTSAADAPPADDFPTADVVDYVLGCMVANGNTHEALQRCSCSIDFIKARMDYKAYEQAATILQVQRDTGQRGIFYRDSNWAKRRVEQLEALQAESTLRCF